MPQAMTLTGRRRALSVKVREAAQTNYRRTLVHADEVFHLGSQYVRERGRCQSEDWSYAALPLNVRNLSYIIPQ